MVSGEGRSNESRARPAGTPQPAPPPCALRSGRAGHCHSDRDGRRRRGTGRRLAGGVEAQRRLGLPQRAARQDATSLRSVAQRCEVPVRAVRARRDRNEPPSMLLRSRSRDHRDPISVHELVGPAVLRVAQSRHGADGPTPRRTPRAACQPWHRVAQPGAHRSGVDHDGSVGTERTGLVADRSGLVAHVIGSDHDGRTCERCRPASNLCCSAAGQLEVCCARPDGCVDGDDHRSGSRRARRGRRCDAAPPGCRAPLRVDTLTDPNVAALWAPAGGRHGQSVTGKADSSAAAETPRGGAARHCPYR